MACCMSSSPQSSQCSWCSHIYPRERLYSRNCPRKRRQPLSNRTQQQHTNENVPTPTNQQLNNKRSTISVHKLIQATLCGDSETLREILYSESFSFDPERQQKATNVLSTSLYSRQFSIFNMLMDFHERSGQRLNLDSATHYFAIGRNEPLLVTAARMNYVEGVRRMLQGDAQVDAMDSVRRTALWTACSVKGLAMVDLLLNYGADIDVADDSGFTPLMVSVRAREPSLDIIENLLRNGSEVNASIFTFMLHKTNGKLVEMVNECCLLTPWNIFKTIQSFLYTFLNNDTSNRRKKSIQCGTIYQYLKYSEYSRHPVVPKLKQLSRKVIRDKVKDCYPWKLENGLELLPLPKMLKLFLTVRDN